MIRQFGTPCQPVSKHPNYHPNHRFQTERTGWNHFGPPFEPDQTIAYQTLPSKTIGDCADLVVLGGATVTHNGERWGGWPLKTRCGCVAYAL